jgi:hypothetical protein
MVTRVILLVVLTAFLPLTLVCADDTPTLPSRKAKVVVPLLQQLSPKDSPQSILDRIKKILGKADSSESGGPKTNFLIYCQYGLDDDAEAKVIVAYRRNEVTGLAQFITVAIRGSESKVCIFCSDR